MQKKIFTGGIEGFFGTPWDNSVRLSYPAWLSLHNYDFYIYAPKNDSALRLNWSKPYSQAWLDYLSLLAANCQRAKLSFGLGFTPLGATSNLKESLPLVRQQIKILCERVKPQILAINFDDLKIDAQDEAKKQNELLHTILEEASSISPTLRFITCPSYYSPDPILEKVFGKQPPHYHEDFTKNLPQSVDIFWTGSRVISETYSAEDLKIATELLGRKPFIWDNYPVNDGKKASDHLYLEAFKNREAISLYSSGIAINPMKQARLSKIPLATLAVALRASTEEQRYAAFTKAVAEECRAGLIKPSSPSSGLEAFLIANARLFASTPLPDIDPQKLASLREELRSLPQNSLIPELERFLEGGYSFDPSCLTG